MAETFEFQPQKVCSRLMKITYEGDTILKVQIVGGCPGNTQGVSALLAGMKIDEAIERLDGIQCRNGTSCPDQLAKGLKKLKAEKGI